MRLISINIWSGTLFQPLMRYVADQAMQTDIFCFQEVNDAEKDVVTPMGWRTNYRDLQRALPGHAFFFAPLQHAVFSPELNPAITQSYGVDVVWGLAVAVRRPFLVSGHRATFVHRTFNSMLPKRMETVPRCLQQLAVHHDAQQWTICNFFGLWHPSGKGDTPERMEQFQKVRAVMDGIKGPKILCGDFNVRPKTKCLAMLEENMMNCISAYGVTTTRSRYYTKPEKFADYVFVSPDIHVRDFQVPNVSISDHLPMILDFD